jgi:hypothetical protein
MRIIVYEEITGLSLKKNLFLSFREWMPGFHGLRSVDLSSLFMSWE